MLVACLSWYDEPLTNLHACVSSLAGVADQLLAVDGAFEHYPHGLAYAPLEQHAAIRSAATAGGLPYEIVTLDAEQPLWSGDVAKRAWMMGRGVELADGGWLLVIDGDETIEPLEFRNDSGTIQERLRKTPALVAEVELRTLRDGHEHRHPARRLFRARPGLTVRDRHCLYVVGPIWQQRVLWDGSGREPEEPAEDLTKLLALRHHIVSRSDARQAARSAWYVARDTLRLET